MKKILLFVLSVFLTVPSILILPCAAFPAVTPPAVDAGGYVLMEKEEQKILLSAGSEQQLSPASTTKIMTCLVVLEHCSPDEEVIIPAQACGVEGSSAYLRKGESLTVKDLLYCLMLRSANDAAEALALYTAGSIEAFADMMNEKAHQLQLAHTHFANPHGLSAEGHYTSAADLGKLTCYALENPLFAEIVSTKSIVIGTEENTRTLSNHNRLLYALSGCIGVKTGYTIEAGRCLVTACKRNDTTLVCVTLSCRNDWMTHTALYEYGFKTVRRYSLEEEEFTLPFAGSDIPMAVGHGGYTLLASPDDRVEFVRICPHTLFAPISNEEPIGYISVQLNGKEVDKLDIVAKEERADTGKPGFFRRLVLFFLSLFGK